MKVLMPVLHYWPVIGGLEAWTQNIAERISDKAEIFVVTGKVKNQPLEEVKNKVKISRVSLFFLKNLSYSSPVYILTTLPYIFLKSLNLIKKEKINLLHCQGFSSSFVGFLLSRLTGIPYIVTVQRIERKGNIFKEMVYRRAFYCIGASRAVERYFEAIGAKNIEVIPNGIDLARFEGLNRQKARQKLGLGENEFVVMTVARLEKVKGIEHLIRAVNNFTLIIIGNGSERKNLEKLVRTLGLEKKVRFLGQVPNKEILGYLIGADCFCLPSLREGFGIVVLEAQAAAIPVIGTKIGGILDLVEDQETGILVEPKNYQQIQEAVLKIQSNPGFAQNLVSNAKNNLKKYEWQNISLRVFELYENCYSHTNLSS